MEETEAPFEISLREQVPDQVRSGLGDLIELDEEMQLSVSADIKLDGEFGSAWLLATEQRLIAFSPDGGQAPEIVQIPLAQIDGLEIRELFGSGELKVRTAERGATVALFSKSLIPKFAEVPGRIETLVKQARPEAEGEKLVEGRLAGSHGKGQRCPGCGRVLHRQAGLCPACLDGGKLLFRLLRYALPYWKIGALSLGMMLVATAIGLTPPLLMRTLIDDVLRPAGEAVTPAAGGVVIPAEAEVSSPGAAPDALSPGAGQPEATAAVEETVDRTGLLGVLVLLLLLVNLSRNGLGAVRSYLLARLGQRITFDLRNQVYRHLHRLSLSFYNERETGRIMASVTQDVGRLQDFISDGLQQVIRDILTLLIICIILFWMNAGLAALVLLPTPVLVFVTLYFGKRLHEIFHGLWRRWAGLSALLADTIPGVRVVKAFAQEKREVDKFEGKSRSLLNGELRVARLRSMFTPSMAFLTSLGTLIIWWVGGRKVLDGSLTLGEFVAFTGYMWQFYGPVESLCRLNHRFQHAATSAERVFEVLDTQPDVADRPDAVAMPPIQGRVEFRDVTFGYESGKPVLENLDFAVEPGEMIGLAGHSGAGKSTLINLICRFYEVEEGAVLIDGHDIRDVGLKSLRDQIGVVLQDPFLFNGTAAENIAYGKPGASVEEVVAAAKAANAHDFIMDFPEGYDTMVGERGARVSGGERQRISIARAILRDPRILILDEATSSVDTQTESEIQEALARLVRGRTTFAIAHRLSTLKHSHRLLILDQGKLAEMGTHEELIAQDGTYAKLCRMQTELSKIRAW